MFPHVSVFQQASWGKREMLGRMEGQALALRGQRVSQGPQAFRDTREPRVQRAHLVSLGRQEPPDREVRTIPNDPYPYHRAVE